LKWSYAHASLPKQGEKACGDTVVVRVEEGVALLAVIDALGHGAAAAVVAEQCRDFLSEAPLDRDVRTLTEGLHEALRGTRGGTRGVAAMCCLVRGDQVEGCGVGNVELRASRSRVPVMLTPGVLGVQLTRVRVFQGTLTPGARVVMFSDGISPRIDLSRVEHLPTEPACQALLERYRRPHDDATLLVADLEPAARMDFPARQR
jgi:negative regulator of sigma-B (phosphoserine phosphatase)